MPKMKSLLLLLLVMALVAACSEQKAPAKPAVAPGPVADNEENRLAAAKQHLEVVPPQELLSEMSEKVVKMLPEKSQKVFLEVMHGKPLQEATYRISLNALVKHFTVNEIKALTAFYGSPEGKAIRKKFPAYMADVMPQINQEVIAALQKAKQEEQGAQEPQGQMKPGAPKAAEPKAAQPKAATPEKKEPQATKPQPGPQGAK